MCSQMLGMWIGTVNLHENLQFVQICLLYFIDSGILQVSSGSYKRQNYMPDHCCTQGGCFWMSLQVHPYSWDTGPDSDHSDAWKMNWKCPTWTRAWTSTCAYCLNPSKIQQGSISPQQGCREMGLQACVSLANSWVSSLLACLGLTEWRRIVFDHI